MRSFTLFTPGPQAGAEHQLPRPESPAEDEEIQPAKDNDGARLLLHHWVHPRLLHHHLVRCCRHQGRGQTAEKVIGGNLPSLQEACRKDCSWSLAPRSQTLWDTPLWQEAAVHRDQNLTPREQLLPICYEPYQQGPEPSLTLTLSLSPSRGPFPKAGWTNSESNPELWDRKLWVSLVNFSLVSPWVKRVRHNYKKPASVEPRFDESPWQRGRGGLRFSPTSNWKSWCTSGQMKKPGVKDFLVSRTSRCRTLADMDPHQQCVQLKLLKTSLKWSFLTVSITCWEHYVPHSEDRTPVRLGEHSVLVLYGLCL